LPAARVSRRHSRLTLLSHPFPSDPQKTLLRHPQGTLGKPSSDTHKGPSQNPPQTPSKDTRKTLPSGPIGTITRRTAEASNTALSRGGGRVLRDTLAAPRGQGRGVTEVDNPSRVYTKLGPYIGSRSRGYESQGSSGIAVVVGEPQGDHKWVANGTI